LNEFGKALDEGKEIRVVFCDISKAFDRVWHIGFLKKIRIDRNTESFTIVDKKLLVK
jgi:hypothetical protein